MRATRPYQGAVPLSSETEITARRCRARAVTARAQDRSRGSAGANVDNEFPRGARFRAPGSLTGDCPDARQRAVRQRIT